MYTFVVIPKRFGKSIVTRCLTPGDRILHWVADSEEFSMSSWEACNTWSTEHNKTIW